MQGHILKSYYGGGGKLHPPIPVIKNGFGCERIFCLISLFSPLFFIALLYFTYPFFHFIAFLLKLWVVKNLAH